MEPVIPPQLASVDTAVGDTAAEDEVDVTATAPEDEDEDDATLTPQDPKADWQPSPQ